MQHDWTKSTLGHGNKMCSRCFVTDLEADALGISDKCEVQPKPPVAANENERGDEYPEDDDLLFICPVTCQPCTMEEDEFCEDYGCARRAGINVDRDLIL